MPKKIRFLENRIDPRRKGREHRERWVFEPLDMVLAAWWQLSLCP